MKKMEEKKLTEMTDQEISDRNYSGYLEMLEYNNILKNKAKDWLSEEDTEELFEHLQIIADKFEEEINNNPEITTEEQAREKFEYDTSVAFEEMLFEKPFKLKYYKQYVDKVHDRYKFFHGETRKHILTADISEALINKLLRQDRPRTKWKLKWEE